MASQSQKFPREDTAPFLLKLFYRNGAFHRYATVDGLRPWYRMLSTYRRPNDFASQTPPPHFSVYTWPDCTLNELALEFAAANPSALPSPAIGTRLAFQLVFPDLRNASTINNGPPRYAVKDLGSVVVGEGGPGAETGDDDTAEQGRLKSEKDKTLSEARFVVGDYVSCAVLPPLPDGSVAPVSSARRESVPGPREGRGGHRGGFQGRENGFERGRGREGRSSWRDGAEGGFPMGDWRRGERLPDGPGGGRSRGRGRW